MATPISFAGYNFNDVTALAVECKKRILKYNTSLKLPDEDQHFFSHLFTHHPDYEGKVGGGIKYIRWGYHPIYGSKTFIIRRHDDTEATVSWRVCMRKPKRKYQVRKAFRNAIADDVAIFKAKTIIASTPCSITGQELSFTNSRVAYYKGLSFRNLLDNFVTSKGLSWDDIELSHSNKDYDSAQDDGYKLVKLVSEGLAADWRDYHKKMAVMSVVIKNPIQVKK